MIYSIDFEDTYDGLGDQLEEANDNFNDDTFGDDKISFGGASQPVGKDFDFFGQTAKASDAINEEQARFIRHAPPRPTGTASGPSKYLTNPHRTGYEVYKKSGFIPNLQANAKLWGTGPSNSLPGHQPQEPEGGSSSRSAQQILSSGAPIKKMMSVDEVEASMRTPAKKPSPSSAQVQPQMQLPMTSQQYLPPYQNTHSQSIASKQSLYTLQVKQQNQHDPRMPQVSRVESSVQTTPVAHFIPVSMSKNGPQILQRGQPLPQQAIKHTEQSQPRQILQNPRRQQAQLTPRSVEPPVPLQTHPAAVSSGPVPVSNQTPIITRPQQLMQMSEQERIAFLSEDAKRAKRNHKIHLLSKDNGLMTPQDKNFITRIQLQQLVTATGNINENDTDALLSEDFYYQVHSQIRGGSRQSPQQPLSNFAQTYLFQTGSRQGGMSRRHNRGGDNHMQRMEQQVQRAVEAAKLKPKNKQLVIEGSLGKISFSNAKTPKPLLNIKRYENGDTLKRSHGTERQANSKKPSTATLSTSDRKSVLKNIEAVYSTLMKIEDHERQLPYPPDNGSDPAMYPQLAQWQHGLQELNGKLWNDLKVMEPISPESPILHPFIAFLSYPKGKKSVPRIFRHIDQEQRLTILTIIIIHLNVLDVIRLAEPRSNQTQIPSTIREEVELFSQVVMPSLFAYVNDAPLHIVIGLLGLILDRVNMLSITRTKVGLTILTMLISRAELIKQGELPEDQEWDQWLQLYNQLFDTIEPLLASIFPGSINAGQDEYVWRFLAASGVGASPDQQQRLVIAVK